MSKVASDYPVSFPYGATSPPYGTTALPYHRGDDRAMPTGTPVLVNGVQIGLSGSTGLSTGPHLHLGRFVGGKDTNPKGTGFTLPAPVTVTTVASDATNGNYVRLTDKDGVQWVYLHLSQQSVSQGQTLTEGEDMGRIQELEQLANDRQARLNAIGELYSVPVVDGNTINQVIANAKAEKARIDELTRIVGELENKPSDAEAQKKLQQIKEILK